MPVDATVSFPRAGPFLVAAAPTVTVTCTVDGRRVHTARLTAAEARDPIALERVRLEAARRLLNPRGGPALPP